MKIARSIRKTNLTSTFQPPPMNHDHSDHESPSQPSSVKILNEDIESIRETVLLVAGVDCSEEVAAIESALKDTGHVREVKVSILSGKAIIQHDGELSDPELIDALKSAGLKARTEGDKSESAEKGKNFKLLSVIASGVLTGIGLLIGWITDPAPPFLQEVVFSLAVIAGAWFIVPKAIRTLKQKRFDMNVLMTVAVIGAIIIGEWAEAAAVTFLFALSELLESYSVSRARRAIESLMELSPLTALVKRDGEVNPLSPPCMTPNPCFHDPSAKSKFLAATSL